MVETWPAVYASLLQPVDPITSRKDPATRVFSQM